MNQLASQANYDAFINSLKEVKAGSRGWVSFSKAKCADMGISQKNAEVVVKALGLKVETNGGRHGYTAVKP